MVQIAKQVCIRLVELDIEVSLAKACPIHLNIKVDASARREHSDVEIQHFHLLPLGREMILQPRYWHAIFECAIHGTNLLYARVQSLRRISLFALVYRV